VPDSPYALPSATLDWLLEPQDPAVRALALRDLLRRPAGDDELEAAQEAAMASKPIAAILDAMQPEGFWVKGGPGYSPKYRSSVWALLLLAQLGASAARDERIARACAYYLDHALAPAGQVSYNGAPGGSFDCLQGNMCWALLELGFDDPRLDSAFDWMARTVTGEGLAPVTDRNAAMRYYSYKCGPDFACGANNGLSCAWGATKVMLAFSGIPEGRRTQLIGRALDRGVEFLLGAGTERDPSAAPWPNGNGGEPSRNWWTFGFPVFYVTDLLQVAEALTALGQGGHPRLAGTLEVILNKRDEQGRWPLEYRYGSKTWGDFGRQGEPSKWVTLRASRVLMRAAEQGANDASAV